MLYLYQHQKKQTIVLLNLQFNSYESGICNAHQYKLVGER